MSDFFTEASRLAMLLVIATTAWRGVATCQAEEKPLAVFVCAGQSNMVGQHGLDSELEAELATMPDKVFVFDGKQWRPIDPGNAKAQVFGPEVAFAVEMSRALNEPVGIIKYSKGGTNLADDWNPESATSLYATLLKRVQAAQGNRSIRLAGMIWVQGERDAKFEPMARSYGVNLAGLVAAARKDFAAPGMRFVSGVVNPPPARYPFVEIVRESLMNCDAQDYGFASTDGLEKLGDNLHYSPTGLAQLGRRLADAMLGRTPDRKIAAD